MYVKVVESLLKEVEVASQEDPEKVRLAIAIDALGIYYTLLRNLEQAMLVSKFVPRVQMCMFNVIQQQIRLVGK